MPPHLQKCSGNLSKINRIRLLHLHLEEKLRRLVLLRRNRKLHFTILGRSGVDFDRTIRECAVTKVYSALDICVRYPPSLLMSYGGRAEAPIGIPRLLLRRALCRGR